MAIVSSNNYCRNMKPPNSTFSSSSYNSLGRSTQSTWLGKEGSWRSQWLVGMACMIISTSQDEQLNLVAMVDKSTIMANYDIAEPLIIESSSSSSNKQSTKWSHRRQCQPWRLNSLEIIVPENLPRPLAHHKWKQQIHHYVYKVAPNISSSSSQCFTM